MKGKYTKLFRIELAVGIAVVVCILVSIFAQQHGLAKGLIRLHISASSDSSEDQALKLAVRDRLLADFFEILPTPETAAEARRLMEAALPLISALAEDELQKHGRADMAVAASLESEVFPTRHYPGFSLPAGEYYTLRLNLGEGGGANWWCVMFPPLCAATSVPLHKSAFPAPLRFIRQDGAEFNIRFQILEWFYAVKARFSP